MKTAKENINSLPNWCYGLLLMDQSLIILRAGETGYYPIKGNHENYMKEAMAIYEVQTPTEVVDRMNADKGISKGQRAAMEWGSQFGYEHQAANVNFWNEDGTPKRNENEENSETQTIEA